MRVRAHESLNKYRVLRPKIQNAYNSYKISVKCVSIGPHTFEYMAYNGYEGLVKLVFLGTEVRNSRNAHECLVHAPVDVLER